MLEHEVVVKHDHQGVVFYVIANLQVGAQEQLPVFPEYGRNFSQVMMIVGVIARQFPQDVMPYLSPDQLEFFAENASLLLRQNFYHLLGMPLDKFAVPATSHKIY